MIHFLIGDVGGTFGTLPGWLTLLALVAGIWKISQSGGGAAVSELSEANKVLADRLQSTRDEMGSEIRDLRVENAGLKAKTDITIALAPLVTDLKAHEERSQERATVLIETGKAIQHALESLAEAWGHDTFDRHETA